MLICGDAGIGRQASLRCLCQYWRVGSSPISRTSVKDIRYFECPLFLYPGKSAKYYHQKQSRWNRTKSLILWKRNLFRSQTGKPQVPRSVLACGFKSHFPHQCKGHSIFRVSFIFISRQISKVLSSKTVTLESHEISDFVEAELVPQSDRQAPGAPVSIGVWVQVPFPAPV